MNPSDLVLELGQRLHLTGLTFTDGVCRLVFDPALAIDLEDDGHGQLVLHTTLGQVPHDNREAFLRGLLSAHLFGFETDGAVFGVHPQTDEVFLFRILAVDDLTVDRAYAALETFAHHAETWRQKINELGRDGDAEPSAGSDHEPAIAGVRV
ncbi:type III secretion system chaperone [Horticoccus sp. 23ND18S-11]|uniref:type III secretion system chaperone n=1 Tax=Horticoccus sp. 23ND18S-11 TaxID=3391832 RepID=UPI0039C9396A